MNSVIISGVLRILASQNRFKSLYNKLFNIDRFLDSGKGTLFINIQNTGR